MKTCLLLLGMLICLVPSISAWSDASQTSPHEYEALKQRAETLYADKSYARANELYRQADAMTLPPEEARWVDFRLADTAWRAQAGTQTHDTTIFDRSARELQDLIRSVERQEDRDRVWAEANESLGDFWWDRAGQQDWGSAWPHYQNALDWWAGSEDLEIARDRYLNMVWTMSSPNWMERHIWNHTGYVPLEILDNALEIAQTVEDRSHVAYLVALTLSRQGDWAGQLRVSKAFEQAMEGGAETDWYDDSLYGYAEWLAVTGEPERLETGHWTRRTNYVKALDLYRRLVREFQKGQTRYFDNANERIEQITGPVVEVGVSNFFLPGSEIQFAMHWRNVKEIDLTLHRIDLVRDVDLAGRTVDQMLSSLNLAAAEAIKTWRKPTDDKGDHQPGQAMERFDEPLEPGAYVLSAVAGGKTSRELVLVTDAAIIMKSVGDETVLFACNALNSKPLPGATVRLWKLVHDDRRWHTAHVTKTADQSGLCVFDKSDFKGLPESRQVNYFAAVAFEDRQALATSQAGWKWRNREPWRIYAFTDRPAYRPGETVNWKLIARAQGDAGFTTPAEQSIEFEIIDPRGAKLSEGTATLNAFGSAWGSFPLSDTTPLGEYRVNYWMDKARQHHLGGATLFRLEEYKLPEFQVAISVPEIDGRKKAFILGEEVEATIQADYYFGGPVANASVEVVVHQNPYHRWWQWPREFPWVYEDQSTRPWWGGDGPIVKRETIKTDSTGKAVIAFETPGNDSQDYEYQIEARVVDASRREIVASGTVRVMRQRYEVHARPIHKIFKPGDTVEIEFKAMDANDQPVAAEGSVRVTREQWIEIWVDPVGKEFTGEALRHAQQQHAIWPPVPPPGTIPWRLTFQGYRSEDVLTTTVKLDDNGAGAMIFTPTGEGYYRIGWTSSASKSQQADTSTGLPITTETFAWVADNETSRLGYRTGGVEIIADKDTFRVGQVAPVMISTPTNDRYVLFTVEGDDLHSHQVVHVQGNVKLVNVPIDQRHVPNVYLNAALAHDGQLFNHQQEVIVPPVEQYLNVEVVADRSQYEPGDQGSFFVTTKNHEGKPVSAEVALAVVDEAVTYIQEDYAGDPRQFFFERRQNQIVQTGSSFQHKSYIKWAKGENKELIDARLIAANERDQAVKESMRYEFTAAGRAGQLGYAPPPASPGSSMVDAAGEMSVSTAMEGAQVSRSRGFDQDMARAAGKAAAPMDDKAGGAGEPPAIQVRSDFRSTLFWQPDIVTDEDGTARVTLSYADSLTAWKATARVVGQGNQFGIGHATTRTKMPLIARLQAPRFFLVGDTVTVSGVINNNTDHEQTVTPALNVEGLTLVGMLKDGQLTKGDGTMVIAANSEARVDWQVEVESPGEAKLTLTARSAEHADAMERTFTVHEHGVQRLLARSGKVRGDEVKVTLDIPSERKIESTVLAVQVAPSMAVTMLDALPYLIDYPYGCTEQTMSRFLPAIVTAKTLRDIGLKPEDAMSRVFGGIEQETAGKTHPKGKRDLAQLQQIANASLERLYNFQHADGGWGWWKDGDSDHFMTAYVLWGLCMAQEAELDVRPDVIERAANWLDQELVEAENAPDMQAWLLHALAAHHALVKRPAIGDFQAAALENLFERRDQLNAYTRALLALSAHALGDEARARTLVENLANGVKRDARPDASVVVQPAGDSNGAVIGTAHWGEDGLWWRWSDGGVEATSFALRALLAIDPDNELVEPVTNWLIKNRRGAQWSNTRDTAIVVLAMNDYLRQSGELTGDLEYEVLVNGRPVATRKLSSADFLNAPSRFEVDRDLIRDGGNEVRIVRKSGDGPIYFSAEASFFSLEEPIPAGGNEIFVRRAYYKLVPRPTLLKGYVYDRLPLPDGGHVASGERVEVVMTIESKNNYEYLVFEDLKPAGLEAVAVRSGEPMFAREMKAAGVERAFGNGEQAPEAVAAELANADDEDFTGRQRWVYQELRDRKVAMFIDRLPEGIWELRYDLRAETPGRFHALPVMGFAMYVPEIKCNSAEVRLSVTDQPAR